MVERQTVVTKDGYELWQADPGCEHVIIDQFYSGGGYACKLCGGWLCL